MNRHKTARGREFNMAAFSAQQGDTIAVGNTLRNARGDVVDKYGKVVKSAKEIQEAYYNRNPNAVKKVSIKEDGTLPSVDVVEEVIPQDAVTEIKEYINEEGVAVVERTFADGSVEVEEKPVKSKKK